MPPREIARRVNAVLALVELGGYGDRMPSQISGGQQQRVALARALVMEPPLLLLDEPLSSLDLKLRLQMRGELLALQRRLRTTSIFVTHDQTEALSLSDRVAVLSHGHIEQIGKPQDIYLRPASRFVAEFIGSSNLLPGQLVGRTEGHVEVVTPAGLRLRVRCDTPPAASNPTILIRPERIRVIANGDVVQDSFTAEIIALTYLGDDLQLQALIDGRETMLIAMKASSQALPAIGDRLTVQVDPADIFIIPH